MRTLKLLLASAAVSIVPASHALAQDRESYRRADRDYAAYRRVDRTTVQVVEEAQEPGIVSRRESRAYSRVQRERGEDCPDEQSLTRYSPQERRQRW